MLHMSAAKLVLYRLRYSLMHVFKLATRKDLHISMLFPVILARCIQYVFICIIVKPPTFCVLEQIAGARLPFHVGSFAVLLLLSAEA